MRHIRRRGESIEVLLQSVLTQRGGWGTALRLRDGMDALSRCQGEVNRDRPWAWCERPEACGPRGRCDTPRYHGPLVNQLIDADRRRLVIDTLALQSLRPPPCGCDRTVNAIAIAPIAVEPSPAASAAPSSSASVPPACRAPVAPPPRMVERIERDVVYQLGTLLDVLA